VRNIGSYQRKDQGIRIGDAKILSLARKILKDGKVKEGRFPLIVSVYSIYIMMCLSFNSHS
jgi:hypothetical protein